MPKGKHRARLRGVVTSDKMDKTVIVTVERRTRHPLYPKYITRRKSFSVHDEQNRCRPGDFVEIVSCRPFSKTKRWAVLGILKPAEARALSSGSANKEQST